MCGIVGLFDPERRLAPVARQAALERMARLVAHRGPDGEGTWQDDAAGIALGQCRLAIQDPSPAGAQPMVSASGRYVVTYNGELYAFEALRSELTARGVRFRGHSDTEVMLEGFDHLGIVPTLRRLKGIFAFALWDRRERRLHLARDPFGIKPLAVAVHDGIVAFASEISAFDGLEGFDPPVDETALASMLRLGCVPAPRAILVGVEKLEPGVLVTIAPDGGETREVFHALDDVFAEGAGDPIRDRAEATRRLDTLFGEVVESQMISDVPLGAFLSGGIDSSTVVAMMGARLGRRVRTFSIGFEDPRYDESGAARAVAAHLGTEHEELILTPSAAAARVVEILGRHDEPFADSSAIPTFLVCEMARRHVTVVLSGDGGDELFAGYTRHRALPRVASVAKLLPAGLRRGIGAGLAGLDPLLVERLAERLPASARPRLVADKARKLGESLAAGDLQGQYDLVTAQWPPDHRAVPGARAGAGWRVPRDEDPVRALQRADIAGYMADDILVKVDRASMAVSLEARVPFLDPRVVAFAARIPTAMKIENGVGKAILRDVLARHVPRALFERPKAGFAVPIADWLRTDLRPIAEEVMTAGALGDAGLDPAIVRPVWDAHLTGRIDHARMIWPVLALALWRRGREARRKGLSSRPTRAMPAAPD